MRHFGKLGLLLAAAALVSSATASAEVAPAQREQVDSLEKALEKTSTLYRGRKYDEAAEVVVEARKVLEELAASGAKETIGPLVLRLEKRLAAAQRLLKAKGIDLPGVPAPGDKPGPRPVGGAGVSFTKEVLPTLAGKCANCHIRNSRGGFSMATFASLVKGSESGIVFTPGKSQGSRLVEVIETGDMPRGGGAKVTPEELAVIVKWIDEGARFDGPDAEALLSTLVPQTNQPDQPMLEVVKASGSESVQFVRDLAPVLVESCLGCHGGMQPRGRLSLETFASLLRGGDSGLIVIPGKPADSLLVQKLRGTAGERMPLGKPPLEEDVIQKFETWIAEGTRLDWPDPAQPLDMAVRIMVATKMSHQELAAWRIDMARKNWRLASPNSTPELLEADHFILLGIVPPARLAEVAELAKAQQAKVSNILKLPAAGPFLKGRLTLFVFSRRFDYSEFGTMVEKRELPPDRHAHWRYTVVDAYACLVAPNGDDPSAKLVLAEQFAGAYLESLGKVPRWFAAGSARVIAVRAEPKNPTAKEWDEAVKTALAAARAPDDFMKGDVLSTDAAALGYGFMKALMTKMPKYLALLEELGQGVEFEAAFRKHYGADPNTLAAAWAKSAAYTRR